MEHFQKILQIFFEISDFFTILFQFVLDMKSSTLVILVG